MESLFIQFLGDAYIFNIKQQTIMTGLVIQGHI